MASNENLVFRLDSCNTTYAFKVNSTGHLEHLYYGKKLNENTSFDVLSLKQTNPIGYGISYSENNNNLFFDNLSFEISTSGKGDFRTPAVDIDYNSGLRTLDFVYTEHKEISGKPQLDSGLAQSYSVDSDASTLIVELKDKILPIYIHLYYTVFYKSDVISRCTVLENRTKSSITIKSLASMQIDFADSDWNLVSFDGAWARERNINRRKVQEGKTVISSNLGITGHNHSSLFSIERPDCTEQNGECYSFSLVYSGNFENIIEKTPYGMLRVLSGINHETFDWKLEEGELFIVPEAVMTYSSEGTNKASLNLHHFTNNHIIRGIWKRKERPITFNTWEAVHFDYDEKRILELAKNAKNTGIELFVIDDGWFANRDNDRQSLGDWFVNTKKFPSGLAGISSKIHRMGLSFGLWVEPEMISRRSMLFGEHPDWAVVIPEREPSVGRNQMILDLTRQEIRDYIVSSMSRVFTEGSVDYVKWDMNRAFSDIASLKTVTNGMFLHRYIQGLYDIMDKLTKAFPEVLFEGSAAGGGRFDLGMLCYMNQIWTSDNTDVLARTAIQEGTSYGFSLNTMINHVTTSPNLQTLRISDIESRFNVACFGVLGYQLDLSSMSLTRQNIIKNQIEFYKKNRALFQFGSFYRLPKTHGLSDRTQWAISDQDANNIIVLDFQRETIANPGHEILRIPFADSSAVYEISSRIQSSDTLSIKETETEQYRVSGDILANAGIPLNSSFSGTECNEGTRVIGDFGSRLYIIKKVNKN